MLLTYDKHNEDNYGDASSAEVAIQHVGTSNQRVWKVSGPCGRDGVDESWILDHANCGNVTRKLRGEQEHKVCDVGTAQPHQPVTAADLTAPT